MCVICALPVGTSISEKEFENCWSGNPDGGGFMYLNEKGNIKVFKSMKYDNMRDAFNKAFTERKEHSPFILHFRIGTHGKKDIDNVHPFYVNQNLAFCHNGIISLSGMSKSDPRSDTRVFNDEYLSLLPRNFLRNQGIRNMIEEMIGYSKLAFLDTRGNIDIINKKAGIESENRWFSNSSFKTYSRSYHTYPTGTGYPVYGKYTSKQSGMPVRTANDHLEKMKSLFPDVNDLLEYWDENEGDSYAGHIFIPGDSTAIKCSICDKMVEDTQYSYKYGACEDCYFSYFDNEGFIDERMLANVISHNSTGVGTIKREKTQLEEEYDALSEFWYAS